MHTLPIARSSLLSWLLLATLCTAQAVGAGPFMVRGKPPAMGYLKADQVQVAGDLLTVPMVTELAGVSGVIEARDFSALRRAAGRDPISDGASVDLSDDTRLAVLHLVRRDEQVALEVHRLEDGALYLRSIAEQAKVWEIKAAGFDMIGVRWPEATSQSTNQNEEADRFVLEQPYIESPITLNPSTVRIRFKNNFVKLSRDIADETYRVRLPKDYKAGFPVGVLVWISPTPDGRIPVIFEPMLDELGMIAIGVDGNGNDRPITDRLQNHLDSIETLGDRYRIDRERVYVTGMSGGGKSACLLQLGFPDVFAGAVPIVGMNSYERAPTGTPGRFWPARMGKPSGKWWRLLKERRIGAITGSADFNEPEMSVRYQQLLDDGLDIRLDVIEGMAHTLPSSDQFGEALKWVDAPRRAVMVESFRKAKGLMAAYIEEFGDQEPVSPKARKMLIEVITLAPWTEPAWKAVRYLGIDER